MSELENKKYILNIYLVRTNEFTCLYIVSGNINISNSLFNRVGQWYTGCIQKTLNFVITLNEKAKKCLQN